MRLCVAVCVGVCGCVETRSLLVVRHQVALPMKDGSESVIEHDDEHDDSDATSDNGSEVRVGVASMWLCGTAGMTMGCGAGCQRLAVHPLIRWVGPPLQPVQRINGAQRPPHHIPGGLQSTGVRP